MCYSAEPWSRKYLRSYIDIKIPVCCIMGIIWTVGSSFGLLETPEYNERNLEKLLFQIGHVVVGLQTRKVN